MRRQSDVVLAWITSSRGRRPNERPLPLETRSPQVIRMIRIVRDLSNVGRFVEWIRISIRQQISSPCLRVSLPV